jgi:hypothetical protein
MTVAASTDDTLIVAAPDFPVPLPLYQRPWKELAPICRKGSWM